MMLSKLLFILAGAAVCVAQNSTKSTSLEFNIDEVLMLNRLKLYLQCLSWSWYVSVEMQLYILAPALIYPMWR